MPAADTIGSQPPDSLAELSASAIGPNDHSPGPASPRKGPKSQGGISGAAVMTVARGINFAVSILALAIIARLLVPEDYGVVAMVTAATNFFVIFSDFGLSLVTVQRPEISQQQLSTLFWINCAFGLALAAATLAASPILVWLNQGETRLYAVTAAMALVFPISTLRVQHEALLKRNMFFRRLGMVRTTGVVLGAIVGVSAAFAGLGYWSLVLQTLATEAGATGACWIALGWTPGLPRRCEGLRNMLGFGGALTAHGVVGYWANNLDNMLIGRYWGDRVLGLYYNSYQLMMRPISLAGYGVGEAAIPAMARAMSAGRSVQSAFRRMFSVTCLLGLPVCVAGAFWSEDIVKTLLGHQYIEATPILRLLFLAAMGRMLYASTGWVYVTLGRPGRMLKWQLMWTPFVIASFIAGIPYGALGVATGYAIANWIAFIPCFLYCFHGTAFRLSDVMEPLLAPLLCTVFSAVLATAAQFVLLPQLHPGITRLTVRLGFAAILYAITTLAFVPVVREAWARLRSQVQKA